MTTEEIRKGLDSLDVGHPYRRAVQAVLAAAKECETLAVAQPGLKDSERSFNAGRLSAVIDLDRELFEG